MRFMTYYGKKTADGVDLTEGMKVFARWPSEGIYEFSYTFENDKWNCRYSSGLNRICSTARDPNFLFSTKKALLAKYPELKI